MIPVLDTNAWIEKLRELERPGADNILAFYEHRFGAICRDPRLMLAPLDDHLVHRGDGVFETIRFTERKVIHLDAHLRRLANSAAGLSLTLPCPIEEIRDIVLAVAKAGDEPEGNIRILSGRGPGGFGIALKECPQPACTWPPTASRCALTHGTTKGLTAFRSDVPVKPAMFARLKTTNYLSAVFMTLEAMQKHMDVALTFDANGCLTEAAIANVAVVDAKGRAGAPRIQERAGRHGGDQGDGACQNVHARGDPPHPAGRAGFRPGDDDPRHGARMHRRDPFRGQAHRRRQDRPRGPQAPQAHP